MKKLKHLLIVEADSLLKPLLSTHASLLAPFSERPVEVQSFSEAEGVRSLEDPQLLLFHSDFTCIQHLRQFVSVCKNYPYSSIVVVSTRQDEELCLLALEAGADDCVLISDLTQNFLRRAAIISGRRHRIGKEWAQNREQLLACLQSTPNVAVQWYNSKSEVLFWNHASERIFGWKAEEAVGRKIDELIVIPENRDFWRNKIHHLAETGESYGPQEWTFRYRDGREGCCISTLVPIPSFDDKPWFVCMDVEITERKEAEKALRESEEKYYELFNQASDAIFINTLEGKLLNVNERACTLLGHPKEKLLQMRVEDLYSAEEMARRPVMHRELAAGQRIFLEREMTGANGRMMAVEVTAQQLKDGRVMAIIRDVTERKKAETALQQSEEKYRLLIEQQADAIIIFDKRGKIRDVNSTATSLLQHSKEEFKQLTVADVLLKEGMIVNPVDFLVLEAGTSTIMQRKMRRKDGSVVETEVHAKRLYEGIFLASVRDITDRLEIQNQLQKEIALSDTIINSLPGLFYLIRKDGKQLRWNKRLETLSGYTPEEISNMSPLDFFAGDDVYDVFHTIEKVFETGSAQVEAYLVAKDGSRIPFYFTGIAVEYGDAECLLGTAIDLSVLKRLEKELAAQKIAAQKKIMQAMIEAEEKEKAKLGLELHDNVNQILSVVRMYLAILASDQPMEEVTLPKAMDLLNTAIQEIRNLSHSLAVSYKFETGLAGSLQDVVENIRAAKDFLINLSLPTDLDERTNANQKLAIYRIVQEQLSNVMKHAKAKNVNARVAFGENEIQVKIEDDGKGFNASRTKKGLGLNNIVNRAEALGGRASVYSQPGKGCRLEVIIPLEMQNEV